MLIPSGGIEKRSPIMIDSAIERPLSGSRNEIARDETFLEIEIARGKAGCLYRDVDFVLRQNCIPFLCFRDEIIKRFGVAIDRKEIRRCST